MAYQVGQYVAYRRDGSSSVEIGRIASKGSREGTWFVCYHGGETAACTDERNLMPIDNDYTIVVTTLGGGRFDG
jgi:hypothetical protein